MLEDEAGPAGEVARGAAVGPVAVVAGHSDVAVVEEAEGEDPSAEEGEEDSAVGVGRRVEAGLGGAVEVDGGEEDIGDRKIRYLLSQNVRHVIMEDWY